MTVAPRSMPAFLARAVWTAAAVCAVGCASVIAGCKSRDSSQGAADAGPPIVESAVCAAARAQMFGDDPKCVETPQPDLDTAAGKVIRVMDGHDPLAEVYFALIGPGGAVASIGSGAQLEDAIEKAIGYRTKPELLPAWQRATLLLLANGRTVLLRCRDAADKLPGDVPCASPSARKVDGVDQTEAIIEVFPHPDDPLPSEHMIARAVWRSRGDGALEHSTTSLAFPKGDDWPAALPPRRGPLPAPARVAKPVDATAEDSRAICDHVREVGKDRMSIVRGGWEPCKALHYPSLDIEDVKHWFVQGAGGNRPLVARRKGNGAIELMTPHWSEHEFFAKGRALLAAPDAVRADVFLSLFLLYTDASEIIRCRPGTGDTLPGGCFEPTFERDGGKLFVKVIKEERPSAARGAVSIRKGMFVTPGKLWRYRYEFDAQTWDEKGGAGDGIP